MIEIPWKNKSTPNTDTVSRKTCLIHFNFINFIFSRCSQYQLNCSPKRRWTTLQQCRLLCDALSSSVYLINMLLTIVWASRK